MSNQRFAKFCEESWIFFFFLSPLIEMFVKRIRPLPCDCFWYRTMTALVQLWLCFGSFTVDVLQFFAKTN